MRLPITPPEAARVRTRDLLRRLSRLPVTAAYRAETGLRNLLARTATDRGWTAAVIPYAGYARGRHARILGRVLLAPADVDPAAQRGVPGWRRLLTLERPGADLEVELAEDRIAIASGPGGLIDTVVTVGEELTPGAITAYLHLPDREPVPTTVYVAATEPVRGLICDIDDTVWITGLQLIRGRAADGR